jgi:predicted NUDIX family phosphoesterase
MEEVIRRLQKNYGMSIEEINKKLCPEFNVNENRNHKQVCIKIHDCEFNVDEKLVNLIKLINKYNLNTISSCQHDMFGWSYISFNIDGFKNFTKMLIKKGIEKYNNIDELYKYDIIERLSFSTQDNNNIHCMNYINDSNNDNFEFIINWNFKLSEIPIIEKEIRELFD